VAGIRMADVHIDEGYLKVMGKGAKERIVPMGDLAQKAFDTGSIVYHFWIPACAGMTRVTLLLSLL
jgi:site-specific recombinase XerC